MRSNETVEIPFSIARFAASFPTRAATSILFLPAASAATSLSSEEAVARVYPEGIHNCIAAFLREAGFAVRTATLDEPEHGLTQEVLDNTDVLFWWGHMAHGEVKDEIVERVYRRVMDGMGMVVLHSGHASKIMQKLMGTNSGELKWREIGEKEILWAVSPSHPILRGLPEKIGFEAIIEPVRELFKDEVRAVGTALGLPAELIHRQPFPGPGLAVRTLGEVNHEKLDILREADAIFREEIAAAGLDKRIWQYFVVLLDVRSTGVRKGSRSYDYAVALRAINSIDAMSATVYRLPYDLLERVTARITTEVEGINRVVYDITGKPPATIEWE